MEAACCERASEAAQKQAIRKIIPVLKPYLHQMTDRQAVISLIKELLIISNEFRGLLDVFLEQESIK